MFMPVLEEVAAAQAEAEQEGHMELRMLQQLEPMAEIQAGLTTELALAGLVWQPEGPVVQLAQPEQFKAWLIYQICFLAAAEAEAKAEAEAAEAQALLMQI